MVKTKDEIRSDRKATFEAISLDLIDDPKNPLRTDLTPESVAELVSSIRLWGIIEPLVVKRKGQRFEVIAGHRRLVAAGIVGAVQAPCYIIDVSDEESEFVKIHENMYREEIAPGDQAEHFNGLMKHHKLTPGKIAKLIGKSDDYVLDRLKILSYPEPLREALDSKQIKFAVAKEFYKLGDLPKLSEYLGYAIKGGISADLAKRWVDEWNLKQQALANLNGGGQDTTDSATYPEQETQCVYCAKPCKLADAAIVYMHPQCLAGVNPNVSL